MNVDKTVKLLEIAVAKSQAKELQMSISIYDRDAHLCGFIKMDAAKIGSIDLAQQKAKTASLFQEQSQNLNQPILNSIQFSHGGLVTIAGGIPLIDHEGKFCGAIGVSGGTLEDDYAIASYCADEFIVLAKVSAAG